MKTSLTLAKEHLELLILAADIYDPGHERFETWCEALIVLRRALDRINRKVVK